MIRTILILFAHDLAVAFKNKTFYLVIGIPLFVYTTLALVDTPAPRTAQVPLALLEDRVYAPDLLERLRGAPGLFALRWVPHAEEARQLLTRKEVYGLLTPAGSPPTRLDVTVIQESSVETLAILQRLAALQLAASGQGPGWVAAVRPLQASSATGPILPTWILMMVLLVSFIVLPAQVAEEKEQQLLLGWLQAPVREGEWLAAKVVYAIVLMLAAVLVLHLMAGRPPHAQAARYVATLFAGGFCFGSLGVCLGLLCRSQASARTLGVLCYLPLLLPAALSDLSRELRSIAPLLPSYHFYEPIRAALLEPGESASFAGAWASLIALGALACLGSHRLIRRRWLMP